MKFIVSRTSTICEELKPCLEAVKEKLTYLDYRTCSMDALKQKGEEKWFEEGKNHRDVVVNGEIWCVREIEREAWVVEIKGLRELVKFQSTYGEIIIMNSEYKEVPKKIEICDDYRQQQKI